MPCSTYCPVIFLLQYQTTHAAIDNTLPILVIMHRRPPEGKKASPCGPAASIDSTVGVRSHYPYHTIVQYTAASFSSARNRVTCVICPTHDDGSTSTRPYIPHSSTRNTPQSVRQPRSANLATIASSARYGTAIGSAAVWLC